MFMAFANFGDCRFYDYLVVETNLLSEAKIILKNQGVDFDLTFADSQEPIFSDNPREYKTKEDVLLNIDPHYSISFYIKVDSTRMTSYNYYGEASTRDSKCL